MTRLWTTAEAAEFLQVTEETVRVYARIGRIPARQVGGRWRFEQADVQAFATNDDPWARTPAAQRRRERRRVS